MNQKNNKINYSEHANQKNNKINYNEHINQFNKPSQLSLKSQLYIDEITKEIKTEIFVEKDITINDEPNNENLILLDDKLYEKIKLNSIGDLNMTKDSICKCELKIMGMKYEKGVCFPKIVITKLYIKNENINQLTKTIHENDDDSAYCIEVTI